MKHQKQGNHVTAFYIETLLLVAVFVATILILTQTFAIARQKSSEARAMTDGVTLARNAAEAVGSADSREALIELLDEGNLTETEKAVTVRYDRKMNPDAEGVYLVNVTWEPEESGLVRSEVSVQWSGITVCSLDTAVYVKEAAK